MHGERSKTRWTRIGCTLFRPLLPLERAIAPDAVINTEELGRAMIRAARQGAPKRVLENRDLRVLGAPEALNKADLSVAYRAYIGRRRCGRLEPLCRVHAKDARHRRKR